MVARFSAIVNPIRLVVLAAWSVAAPWSGSSAVHGAESVLLERLPNGALQPQVAQQAGGTVHLVYFVGDPMAGDLFYCRRGASDAGFSKPIRVNSTSGSAIATGTIRGGQLAIGREGRPHVVWNGSKRAEPRGPKGETPLLYTRLSRTGTSFERERNVIRSAYGLDGGGCIAADPEGRVYIAWHAGSGNESDRRVWLARSDDDGDAFSEERPIDVEGVGACGCCGMQGSVSRSGEVKFLYRSAKEDVHRDMYLLSSADGGSTFTSRKLQDWTIDSCPMSSEAFAHTEAKTWAAWETADQIFYAAVNRTGASTPNATAMQGRAAKRKHPELAVNSAGQVLLVATEGTGWNRGGSLVWQLLDAEGGPSLVQGSAPGIPKWSFAAAFALSDGRFVVLY